MKIFLLTVLLFSQHVFANETSSKLTLGTVSADIRWGSNDTGDDVLIGDLKFTPHEQTPLCQRISFIQTAQVETAPGKDYEWSSAEGQENRNHMRTSATSSTERGFFIDHDAIRCRNKSCSPFYRDSWPNVDYSQDGFSLANKSQHASLHDAPYGWVSFERIRLEACAYCISAGEKRPLGCIDWGGYWGLTGPKTILPIKFHERPTPTFLEALKLFERFYQIKN